MESFPAAASYLRSPLGYPALRVIMRVRASGVERLTLDAITIITSLRGASVQSANQYPAFLSGPSSVTTFGLGNISCGNQTNWERTGLWVRTGPLGNPFRRNYPPRECTGSIGWEPTTIIIGRSVGNGTPRDFFLRELLIVTKGIPEIFRPKNVHHGISPGRANKPPRYPSPCCSCIINKRCQVPGVAFACTTLGMPFNVGCERLIACMCA